MFPKIDFTKMSSSLEDIKLNTNKKYNFITILETLEHVVDEKQSIENLYNITQKWWTIIVSVPIEYWLLFFIKDLWRRLIIRKDFHPIKELFRWLLCRIDKIKRVPRSHKWYDYKKTKKLLIKQWFTLHKSKYYPFSIPFMSYGVIFVFKKQ